jgi:hypothetical protein
MGFIEMAVSMYGQDPSSSRLSPEADSYERCKESVFLYERRKFRPAERLSVFKESLCFMNLEQFK